MFLSDSDVSINLKTVSPLTDRELSSVKLCIEGVSVKGITGNNFVIVAISIIYLILLPTLKNKSVVNFLSFPCATSLAIIKS